MLFSVKLELHFTTQLKDMLTLRKLVQNGADVNAVMIVKRRHFTKQLGHYFTKTAWDGHVDVVVLIQNGADVNAVEKFKQTGPSPGSLGWTC